MKQRSIAVGGTKILQADVNVSWGGSAVSSTGKRGSRDRTEITLGDEGNRDRNLWRAVIKQAMYEACNLVVDHSKATQALPRERAVKEARRWLLGNSRDFNDVCHLAMFDPSNVRMAALKLESSGWQAVKHQFG